MTTQHTTTGAGATAARYGSNGYTRGEILAARNYWSGLTPTELIGYWRREQRLAESREHATISFWDWLVWDARQASYERAHDI